MKTYEYKTTWKQKSNYKNSGMEHSHLNEQGNDGWQLCAISESSIGIYYYWKRESADIQ